MALSAQNIALLKSIDNINSRSMILLNSHHLNCAIALILAALDQKACQLGYKALYFNIQKLFPKLKMMKADGSYSKEISKIEKYDLLILDDFGLQPFDNTVAL